METRIYSILVKLNGEYVEAEEIDYTEQEAKAEIKRLREERPNLSFKLKYLRTEDRVLLTSAPKRKNKPGAGRPRRPLPTTAFNFRIDNDLREWANQNRGKKSMTQFLNDIIRERKEHDI